MLAFWLGVVAFIGVLAVALYPFIRYGVISPRRTRGAEQRLRHPDSAGIERICGFAPSPELVAFYQKAPFIELSEFSLLDRSATPPVEWEVFEFIPLRQVDVSENRKISNVDGIPIAYDGSKGTYFVTREGTVALDSPNVPGRKAVVARSITDFARFESH
jgi:hypothetical protein